MASGLDSRDGFSVPSPHSLEASLLNEIQETSRILGRAARSRRHPGKIRVGERTLLRLLDESGPLTVPQIARRRGTSRQCIQLQVNRLARKGYLALVNNPDHKRSVWVQLTERGKGLLKQCLAEEDEWSSKALLRIPKARLSTAIEVLRELVKSIGEAGLAGSPAGRRRAPGRSHQLVNEQAELTHEPDAATTELPVNLL